MAKEQKKVLFIVTKSGMGGASRAVHELVTALPKDEYEPVVAAGGTGELFERLSKDGVRTISIPTLERDIHILREIKTFFFFTSLFVRERPSVIHLHSPKVGGLGALAARITGVKKIIYTAHGWAFFEDRPFHQKAIIRLFSYFTVVLATKTIAVSQKDAHAFDGWLFTKNKITHISNGVALPSSALSRADARTALSLPPDALVIGTIAELHKNKGLSYLIEAATSIPDATFVIVGEGEERKRLMLAIAAHNLEERVLLKGYIPDAHTFIRAFDIFVLPSVKEGLPYVLLEAGAAELPVVAANVGGIPEIIEDGKTGLLVPPKNCPVLLETLSHLIKNPTERALLGSALKQKIEQDFSLDLMVSKTVVIYSN